MNNLIGIMKSQVLYEGRTDKDVSDKILGEIKEYYKGVLTMTGQTMPFGLSLCKTLLQTRNEYKLSAFFNQCIFYDCTNAHPSLKFSTAGVIPWHTGTNPKTIFIYNRPWLESLCSFSHKGETITTEKFKNLYAENPRNPDLGYDMGEMMLLFAHEAMHIFRAHGDRGQKQGKDHEKYNIAADMVINYTLEQKVKNIAGMTIRMPKGGWSIDKAKYSAWLKAKKKYQDKEGDEDAFNRNLNADTTYDYYNDEFSQPEPPKQITDPKEGNYRKILDGPNKGKYIKVTKVNDDGSMEGEIVDMKKVIAQEKLARKGTTKLPQLRQFSEEDILKDIDEYEKKEKYTRKSSNFDIDDWEL